MNVEMSEANLGLRQVGCSRCADQWQWTIIELYYVSLNMLYVCWMTCDSQWKIDHI